MVDALAHVLADLVADLDLGQVVLGPADEQLEPGLGRGRLEQLALAVDGQVRRIACRVREDGRVAQAGELVDDLPRLTPLEHGHDELLVVGGQLDGALGGGLVGDGGRLDPERGARPGHTTADQGSATGTQDGRG